MADTTRNTDDASRFTFNVSRFAAPLAWLLGAFGLASYLGWLAGAQLGSGQAGWDFRAYYAAAQAIQHGANLYELASPTIPFYLYPPTLAALLAPLSPLSLADATLVWLVVQHLALLAAGAGILRLLARATGWGWAGPGGLALGLLLLLWGTGVPLREEIYLGQVNSVVLALIVGGLLLAGVGSGRPGRAATWGAALCLALAVSIKVFPALLLPWLLLRGRARVALLAGVVFMALQAVVGLLTVGPAGYSSTLDYWFSLFPDLPHRPGAYIDNQSLNGLFARLLLPSTDPTLPTLGDHPRLWTVFTAGGSLLLLGAVAAILFGPALWRRERPHSQPLPFQGRGESALSLLLELGLILVTINIVSSITWPHHLLWWVLPALAILALTVRNGAAPAWPLAAVGVVAAVLALSPGDWLTIAGRAGLPWLTGLGSGMHLYALLLLWAATVAALLAARKVA